MSFIKKIKERGLDISPPKFLLDNVHYEVIMGSVAYGVSNDTSDMDIYGFCIPPKDEIFPHLRGEIVGFGRQIKRFEQWQQHHVEDKEARKEYDFQIFNIVKYFQLTMENNPNLLDSLFVPVHCILSITPIAQMVRDKRKIFLNKKSWHTYKGYSYAQLYKIETKSFEQNEKRKKEVEEFGYSLKFAYHVVRLMNEAEQILTSGDLVLDQNKEQLKSIRRGEWTLDQIKEYFLTKEKQLEQLYVDSKLSYSPDEEAIKNLLLACLEEHYGSLDSCVRRLDKYENAIMEIKSIVGRL